MDEADRYLKRLIPVMVVILIAVFAFTYTRYLHPMPEEDCSAPYDYAVCERAYEPGVKPQASLPIIFLSAVGVAVLAILLTFFSYHASVIEQQEIAAPIKVDKPAVAPPATKPTTGPDMTTIKT
jgi:hypothetical protein